MYTNRKGDYMTFETKDEILQWSSSLTSDQTCRVIFECFQEWEQVDLFVEHMKSMFDVILWDTEPDFDFDNIEVRVYFKERAE